MDSDYKITMQQAEEEMACYRKVFSIVRLLDHEELLRLEAERKAAAENSSKEECVKFGHQCSGCAAMDAFFQKTELSKLEFIDDDIYQIMVKYLEIDGKPYVMELLKALDKNSLIEQKDRERLISSLTGYNERLYRDVLTKVYNRRYYEEELKNQTGPVGIAMIDLDDFKLYNDTYGHNAGDLALTAVAETICKYIRKADVLIRYGGDEFLLVLPEVGEMEFARRLQEIHDKIHVASVPGYAGIQLSVSIGGTIAGADETIESVVGRADYFMYQAKSRKDLVVTESNEIKDGNAGGEEVDREDLKQQILIVDDAELNREILAEILHPDFKTMEACSGEECISMLRQYGAGISLVLLDIVMPGMDGFVVLEEMNRNHWLEDIPVIMISSEETESYIRRAYEMGVSDYISRPFDAKVVYRRVYNTIKLYVKQRRLITLVTDQIREKEKNSQILVDILSHIVEFRNGESGLHVQHIKTLTGLLLDRLVQKTDKYKLQWSDQYMITVASALHDIGKVGIDEKILNKPGRLTNEEFAEMKKHTLIGASMLKSLGVYQDEELVKVAYQICRWHHERYDGKGYPDGLKGEEIPIAAQVVSVADVYDALTSERVYKKAFSHEKAMEMILAGECGTFNPLLLECLKDIQGSIRVEMKKAAEQPTLTQSTYVGKMIETMQ
ncbi:GTP cyclohydrolase IIa [Blautia sp. HCP3S3_H10_1]|uniref:GTP cyclohydrolase IIa n=1 Tax=unclassified Blautia TaxID=2648079 RepID=UPI003F8FECB1